MVCNSKVGFRENFGGPTWGPEIEKTAPTIFFFKSFSSYSRTCRRVRGVRMSPPPLRDPFWRGCGGAPGQVPPTAAPEQKKWDILAFFFGNHQTDPKCPKVVSKLPQMTTTVVKTPF